MEPAWDLMVINMAKKQIHSDLFSCFEAIVPEDK